MTLEQRLREGLEPSFNPRGVNLFGGECKAVVALVEAAQRLAETAEAYDDACEVGGRERIRKTKGPYRTALEDMAEVLAAFTEDKQGRIPS